MTQEIYLAGGCFWGVEHFFKQFPGVIDTTVGYCNGSTTQTSYEEVCAGSGHAECVRIVFDPSLIGLEDLLELLLKVIDPVSHNKQGNDEGIQYRTGVYFTDPALGSQAADFKQALQANYSETLALEVLPLRHFIPAEEYHQDYLEKHPQGYCHIPPHLFSIAQG